MKFNERLIKLRKAKGLSQEELGYELNVTRQTISKWELGESTPEMEKLIQISNFFGISVDELVSNNDEKTSSKNYNKEFVGVDEKYIPNDVKNDTSYVNANKGSKKMMVIPIVAMIVPIVVIIISFVVMFLMQKSARDRMNNMQDMQDKGMEMVNTVMDRSTNIIDNINTVMDRSTNIIDNMVEKSNIENNTVTDDDEKNQTNNNEQVNKQEIRENIRDTEEIINNAVETYQNGENWSEEEWSSKQEQMQNDFDRMKANYEEQMKKYEGYFQNY